VDKDICHVALIVPLLEPALEELTKVTGCGWRPTFEGGLSLHQPGVGYRDVRMRIACSTQEPFLEVIEAVPDTPWALSESGSNLHHIAFYTDDLDEASQHVSSSFCPIEICGVARDGRMPATFTYHSAGGLRIELVARHHTGDAQR
jgi:hypothetical protein